MNHSNLTHIKGQDGLLIVPVKIRFDETSEFSEGSANVSVTTFLSGLQKLPKIGRPRDITFWRGRTDKSETAHQILNQ